MERKEESTERREERREQKLTRRERERQARIDQIREEDPGFIPPEMPPRQRNKAGFWVWIGVAILIILLLIWLSVAMFTGDTDVNLITPFPWV